MKATIDIKLKPFNVPNFAVVDGYAEAQNSEAPMSSVPLSALNANTLERMCDDFRDAVFKVAGKQQPPRLARAS